MKHFLPCVWVAAIVLAACASGPSTPANQPSPVPVSTTQASEIATTVPEPIPTPGYTSLPMGAPAKECSVVALQNGITLEMAPFISQSRLRPTMEPRVVYQAMNIHPTYFQLARDGMPVGWVDHRSIGISSEGGGCSGLFDRPADQRQLTDFPGLCFFTPVDAAEMFPDSNLTGPAFGVLPTPEAYVVLWRSARSLFTSFGHTGPSFYVATEDVTTFGECEGVPTTGTVSTAGWLRSAPDAKLGEDLIALPVGTRLHIEGAPVSGNGPARSGANGQWFQAVLDETGTSWAGWIWSELFTLD